ncbi:hypothetical protein LKO27_08730 [Tessaracoccus sp. OS52]|uniref:hypothetical protein n=1 Tax=Tessaracoccus sp. OS52 TaxID=2886691 RepID=UPI001D116DA7|nr:hypothetical protein [Tessaracoccus sp. OS52]MCC2593491.1 hypothetical protein [Tessaracoccus sp. OS52]
MSELRWYAVVLFIGQLALVVIGALSLWRIAGGWWLGAVVAGVFVLAYCVSWLLLLAPGSPRRLGYKERLTLNLVLGPAVVVLASLASLWLPALVALSVAIMCDALNERSRLRT